MGEAQAKGSFCEHWYFHGIPKTINANANFWNTWFDISYLADCSLGSFGKSSNWRRPFG